MLLLCFILVGVFCGMIIPINIPAALTSYLAIGLLAACNTLCGGVYAQMIHKFDARAFISGFFINTILAIFLTFFGTWLGVDFSLAAIVYFGTRIFNNFAKIRHYILQKQARRVKIKEIRRERLRVREETNFQTSLRQEDDNDEDAQ